MSERECGNTQQNLIFARCARCTSMLVSWTDSQGSQALVTHNTKDAPNLILTTPIIKFRSSFFYDCDCLKCLIVCHNKKAFLLHMTTATHCKGLQQPATIWGGGGGGGGARGTIRCHESVTPWFHHVTTVKYSYQIFTSQLLTWQFSCCRSST